MRVRGASFLNAMVISLVSLNLYGFETYSVIKSAPQSNTGFYFTGPFYPPIMPRASDQYPLNKAGYDPLDVGFGHFSPNNIESPLI